MSTHLVQKPALRSHGRLRRWHGLRERRQWAASHPEPRDLLRAAGAPR
jgi:hypothetical protein